MTNRYIIIHNIPYEGEYSNIVNSDREAYEYFERNKSIGLDYFRVLALYGSDNNPTNCAFELYKRGKKDKPKKK